MIATSEIRNRDSILHQILFSVKYFDLNEVFPGVQKANRAVLSAICISML
jgi:hypothetical protein